MIKYILFDMDGVISDSETVNFRCLQPEFAKYGYDFTEEMYRNAIGLPHKNFAEYIARIFPDFTHLDEITDTSVNEVRRLTLAGKIPAKPFLNYILHTCRNLGLVMAVVSSNREDLVIPTLKGTGAYDCMSLIITQKDITKGKPDPEPYLIAAARLGASPEECLVLEDAQAGIESACRAGMKVICIPDMKQPDAEHASMCDAVLPSLRETADWIRRRCGDDR